MEFTIIKVIQLSIHKEVQLLSLTQNDRLLFSHQKETILFTLVALNTNIKPAAESIAYLRKQY